MADDDNGAGVAEDDEIPEEVKCPECAPGLPAWMATFADLVTLLLTFFVLLLSFAKTETAKYEAALGSVRNAFGGNVLKHGEVIQRGKSPDNFPTMMESQSPIRPFPIEFLTMEGILDKHEINRGSDEDLKSMRFDLKENSLADSVDIYEQPEGIKVRVKDKIFFKLGSVAIADDRVAIPVIERLLTLLRDGKWSIFVSGHASRGENAKDGEDAFVLSSRRAIAVTRFLIKRGVPAEKISTVFYGDTRPVKLAGRKQSEAEIESRRVEFILRKTDLEKNGHKVDSY